MEWLALFGLTLLLTVIAVAICWSVALKLDNFSIIDGVWGGAFFFQALIFFVFTDGFLPRKILLFTMVGIWSLRLGYYLSQRIASHHPEEDTRYRQLRQEYGEDFKSRFFVFYLYQAISVSVLTLPFIFVFQNQNPTMSSWEIGAGVYWLIALIGESVADHQLLNFKKLAANNPAMGRTCKSGLWKYSRHPNYFFESNVWWAFFIFALGSGVYWGIYAPLIILVLLLKVTGVPPSEAQALKNRGEEYRAYQRQTSVFIPWFPKKN